MRPPSRGLVLHERVCFVWRRMASRVKCMGRCDEARQVRVCSPDPVDGGRCERSAGGSVRAAAARDVWCGHDMFNSGEVVVLGVVSWRFVVSTGLL